MKIFSVLDSKAGVWMSPFYMRSSGEAIRSFAEIINGKDSHQFNKYPEDYCLFELGEWDDVSGVITVISPISHGLAVNFKVDAIAA